MKVCNYCPDPKPLKTDADFYPKHPTKCIDCSKQYQKEYRARKKLNPAPVSERKERDQALPRICKECPEDSNQKTEADFYLPTSHQCKKCITRLRKDKRAATRAFAKQVPELKDQRIHDLEEQIRLLNLLNEARQAPAGDRQ